MDANRRNAPRTRRRIRLEYHKRKFLFLQGPKAFGEALDISSTGIKIKTPLPLQKGEKVDLLIKRKVIDPAVLFSGEVKWAKRRLLDGHRFFQAGIAFTPLNEEQRVMMMRLTT